MAKLTLDEIKKASKEEYQSLEVDLGSEKVVLRNALRLDKEERKRITDLGNGLKSEEDADPEEVVREIVKIAVGDEAKFEALAEALGDELPDWMQILNAYMAETQMGEASGSQEK